MPENVITEHWLLRGIQSAFFYYLSCGPCIVVETKWRRQTQARRERRLRQKVRKEKMEYRRRKTQPGETETGDEEEEEDGDNVIEMEVTDPTGSSRVIGVGLSGDREEHMFLPFEINEYWGDETNPSSDAPWWWKRLTGKDPKAAEPNVRVSKRGIGRKRYFRPSGEKEWDEDQDAGKINRDDGDMWPLNVSHPPVLCKGEITKDEVAWIKEEPPSSAAMRRLQGTMYEVDLDKLNQIQDWKGPITLHPAVTKIEYGDHFVERKSSRASASITMSPRTKVVSGHDKKQSEGDANTENLTPSISNVSEKFLTPTPSKGDRTMTPTSRPDSAISASRLKNRTLAPSKRVRSGSHTATSSSDDADDEDDESELSPKTVPTRPKATYQRSGLAKTNTDGQQRENISPTVSPLTIASAVSSSDSLARANWLPPRMLGAKQTLNMSPAASGSTKAQHPQGL